MDTLQGIKKGQDSLPQTRGILQKQPYIRPEFIFLTFLRETALTWKAKRKKNPEKANKKGRKVDICGFN